MVVFIFSIEPDCLELLKGVREKNNASRNVNGGVSGETFIFDDSVPLYARNPGVIIIPGQ